MAKPSAKIVLGGLAAAALVTSVVTTVVVFWNRKSNEWTSDEYAKAKAEVQQLIDKVKDPKAKRAFQNRLNKLKEYSTKNVDLLKQLKQDVTKALADQKNNRSTEQISKEVGSKINSISDKTPIKNILKDEYKATDTTNKGSLLSLEDKVDKVLEAQDLISKVEDAEVKKQLSDDFANAKTIEEIDAIIEKAKQEITAKQNQLEQAKKEAQQVIDSLDNVDKKADLNKELREATTAAEIAKILEKAKQEKNKEVNSDLTSDKAEASKLNDSVKDQSKKDEFAKQIANATSKEELDQIKAKIEETIKAESGDDVLVNAKKEALKEKVDQKPNLSDDKKTELKTAIDNASTLEDTKAAETTVNKEIESANKKADLAKEIEKISDPAKKEELKNKLNEIQGSSDDSKLAEVEKEIADQISDARAKAEEAISKLDGLSESEKETILNNLDKANSTEDFANVTNQANNRFEEEKAATKELVDKISDPAKKAELEKQLEEASNVFDLKDVATEAKLADKKAELLAEVENLSDATKKQELKDKITNADSDVSLAVLEKEIALEKAKEATTNDLDKAKLDAQAEIDKIQDPALKEELTKEKDSALTTEDLNTVISKAKEAQKSELEELKTATENAINKVTDPYEKEKLLHDLNNASNKENATDELLVIKEQAEKQANNELAKAKEAAQAEINKVTDEAKKAELNKELEAATSIDTVNEVKAKAQAEVAKQTSNSKDLAAHEISKVSDPAKQAELNNELANASTPEEVQTVANKAKEAQNAEIEAAKAAAKAAIDALDPTKSQASIDALNTELAAATTLEQANAIKAKAELAKQKESVTYPVAALKLEAQAEISKVTNSETIKELNDKLAAATTQDQVQKVIDQAKAEQVKELAVAKAQANAEIAKVTNPEVKEALNNELSAAISTAEVNAIIQRAKEAQQRELAALKAEALAEINKLPQSDLKDQLKDNLEAATTPEAINALKQDAIDELTRAKAKAQEVALYEINKIVDPTTKDALKKELEAASSLSAINDVKQKAMDANALELAKAKSKAQAAIDELDPLKSQELIDQLTKDLNLSFSISAANEVEAKAKLAKVQEAATDELAAKKLEAEAEINKLGDQTTKDELNALKDASDTLDKIQEVINKAKDKQFEDLSKAREAASYEVEKLTNPEVKDALNNELSAAKSLEALNAIKERAKEAQATELANAKESAKLEIAKVSDPETKKELTQQLENANNISVVKDIEAKAKENNPSTETKVTKNDVTYEIEKLSDTTAKENLTSELENAKTPEEVQKVKEKVEAQKAKELEAAKAKAREEIAKLDTTNSAAAITNLNNELNSANDINAVNEVISKAKVEKAKESAATDLDKAKLDVNAQADKLLNNDKKETYKQEIAAATNESELNNVKDRINADLTTELNNLKEAAKQEVKTSDINPSIAAKFNAEIDAATTPAQVEKIRNRFKDYFKTEVQDVINSLSDSNKEKAALNQELAQANEIYELNSIKNRARVSKENEVNNAKPLASYEIEKLTNPEIKEKFNTELNNATTLAEVESIKQRAKEAQATELANAKEIAKFEISKITDPTTKATLEDELAAATNVVQANEVANKAKTAKAKENASTNEDKAKVETNAQADQILDEAKKTEFKDKINNAITIEEINAIKNEIANDLTTQLNEQKDKANALKDKLSNQEIKDKFAAEINAATTSTQLEAIKDRITKALKAEAQAAVNSLEKESQKPSLNQKLASTNSPEEIVKIKEFAQALLEAHLLTDKLQSSNERTKFAQELDAINDEDKVKVEEIIQKIKEAIAKQGNADSIQLAKEKAKAEIAKILNERDKASLNGELVHASSLSDVNAIIEKAKQKQEQELSEQKTQANIKANDIKDDALKADLKAKVDAATNIEELNKVKKAIEDQLAKELAAAKQAAEVEIAKLSDESKKQELRTELEAATTTDDANAVKDKALREKEKEQYSNEVDRKKVDARSEIAKLTKQENKDPLNTELASADTVELVQAVIDKAIAKQKEELDQTKQEVKSEIARILEDPKKTELSNKVDLSSVDTVAKVNAIKTEAQEYLKTKKAEVTKMVAKLEGLTNKSDFDTELTNADTETKLKALEQKVKEAIQAEKDKLTNSINDGTITKQDVISSLIDETHNANSIADLKAIETKVAKEKELQRARNEAMKIVNKLSDDNPKKSKITTAINNTSKFSNITLEKNKAQALLGSYKTDAEAAIRRLTGDDTLVNKYNGKTAEGKTEAEYKQAKTDALADLSRKAQEVKNQIDALGLSNTQKDHFKNEINNAHNDNNSDISSFTTIKGTADDLLTKVNEAKAYVSNLKAAQSYKDKIDAALNNDAVKAIRDDAMRRLEESRTNATNAVNTLRGLNQDGETHDTYTAKLTDAGDNQDKLDALRIEATAKFVNIRDAVESSINSISNASKREEITNEWKALKASWDTNVEKKTVTEIYKIRDKVTKENARQLAEDAINKLVDGNEKTNLSKTINSSSSNIAKIEEAKQSAIKSLDTSLREANEAVAKLAGHSDHDTLNNKINPNRENQTELIKIREEAKTKFNDKVSEVRAIINSLTGSTTENASDYNSKKKELNVQLNAAGDVTKLEEIKTKAKQAKRDETNLESARAHALEDVKRLKDDTIEKTNITNAINNATTPGEIRDQETEIAKIINAQKTTTNNAISKLDGHPDKASLKSRVTAAENQENEQGRLESIENDANDKFTASKRLAQDEIEKLASTNPKRQELMTSLNSTNTNTVTKLNELKEEAKKQKQLEDARNAALPVIERLKDSKKSELKNAINTATEVSHIEAKKTEAEGILTTEKEKARKAIEKLTGDDSLKGTFNGQSGNGRTQEQYETTVTEVKKEFVKKQDAAKTTIDGLSHLSEERKNHFKNEITNTLANENADISSINTIVGNATDENRRAEELASAKAQAVNIANKLIVRNGTNERGREQINSDIQNADSVGRVEELKKEAQKILDNKVTSVTNKLPILEGLNEGGNQTKANYDNRLSNLKANNQATLTEQELDTLLSDITIAYDNIFDSVQTAINNLPNDAEKKPFITELGTKGTLKKTNSTVGKLKGIKQRAETALSQYNQEKEFALRELAKLKDGNSLKTTESKIINGENSSTRQIGEAKDRITDALIILRDEAKTYISNKFSNETPNLKTELSNQLNSPNLTEQNIEDIKQRADEAFNKVTELNLIKEKLTQSNHINAINTAKANATTVQDIQNAINEANRNLNQEQNAEKKSIKNQLISANDDGTGLVDKFIQSYGAYEYIQKGNNWAKEINNENTSLDRLRQIKEEAELIINKLKTEALNANFEIPDSSNAKRGNLNRINDTRASLADLKFAKDQAVGLRTTERERLESQKSNARAEIAKLEGDGYNKDKLTKELNEATQQSQYDAIQEKARQVIEAKKVQVQGKITSNNKMPQDEKTSFGTRVRNASTIEQLIQIENEADNYVFVEDPLASTKRDATNRISTKAQSTPAGAPSSSSSYKLTLEQAEEYNDRIRKATTPEQIKTIEEEFIRTTFFENRRIVTLKQAVANYITPQVGNDTNKFKAWIDYFKNTLENETSIRELGKKFVQYANTNNIGGNQSEAHRQDLLREWHKWAQEPGIEWAKGLLLNSNITFDQKYNLIDQLLLVHSLFDLTDWLKVANRVDSNIPSTIPTSSNIRFYDGHNWTEIQ
ncbi:hypothetical protein [Mycoplasma sp. 613B]